MESSIRFWASDLSYLTINQSPVSIVTIAVGVMFYANPNVTGKV